MQTGKRYTIHEVARLLGISADAIRLYEKEGLVAPQRDPRNGYRYYEFEQIQRIMGVSLYRQMDIGIPEIRNLIHNQTLDTVGDQFVHLIDENENKIRNLQTKVQKMRFMKQHLERMREGLDICSVRQLPDCYVLYHQDSPQLRYEEMCKIITSPVFSFGNLCYVLEEGENELYLSRRLEFIVRDKMFELTPWQHNSASIPVRKSCSCIYTVRKATADERECWDLQRLRQYAAEQGLECSSSGYAFYGFSLANNESIDDYFEIYLPITEKS